jgi:RNA polymerase sigma factor (sigma-70 family)
MPDDLTPAFLQRLRRLAAPEAATTTDAQLLDRFVRTHDAAAFELLVWRYGPLVLGVCRRLLRHTQDAEDAFQATFLTLVRKASSIGKHASLGSWLYKVAYRVALHARQASASRTAREQRVARGAAVCAAESVDADLHAALVEEVSRLPEKYRAAVVLCYFLGKTHDEAARRLGCPRGTVAVRLLRAKERLRGRLERRGFTLGAAALAAAIARREVMALPDTLLTRTMHAALLLAAGRGLAAGGVSLKAIALMEGTVKAMWWMQFRMAAGAVVALGMLGASGGWVAFRTDGTESPARTASSVAQKEAAPPGKNERQLEESLRIERDRLRTALDKLDRELAAWQADRRKDRIAAEERLRLLEREQTADREREHSRLKAREHRIQVAEADADAACWNLIGTNRDRGKNHPEVKQAEANTHVQEERLARMRVELNDELDKVRQIEQKRTDDLIQTRTRQAELEEVSLGTERRAQTERARLQADLALVEARLQGVQGLALPNFPPLREDAKLDRLLEEVQALRREVRELKNR